LHSWLMSMRVSFVLKTNPGLGRNWIWRCGTITRAAIPGVSSTSTPIPEAGAEFRFAASWTPPISPAFAVTLSGSALTHGRRRITNPTTTILCDMGGAIFPGNPKTTRSPTAPLSDLSGRLGFPAQIWPSVSRPSARLGSKLVPKPALPRFNGGWPSYALRALPVIRAELRLLMN